MTLAVARRLFAALLLSLASTYALAKGPLIINTGDELFEVGDFPAAVLQARPAVSFGKVGYKCAHLGVFWADVWRWNCTMVELSGTDSYRSLPDAIREQLRSDPQYALGKAKRGMWNHYAFWVALSLLGLLGGFRFITRD